MEFGYQYKGKLSLAETKQLKDADEIRAELSAGPVFAAKQKVNETVNI